MHFHKARGHECYQFGGMAIDQGMGMALAFSKKLTIFRNLTIKVDVKKFLI